MFLPRRRSLDCNHISRVKLCIDSIHDQHQYASCQTIQQAVKHIYSLLLTKCKIIDVLTLATSPNKSNVCWFSNFACNKSSIRISQDARLGTGAPGLTSSRVKRPTWSEEMMRDNFSNCLGEKPSLGRRTSAVDEEGNTTGQQSRGKRTGGTL